MANLSEKINFLRQEFVEMDMNHDQTLSREELYTFLDQKSGQIFDRDVADELFDRMDKDHNNKVTVDEYIKVFIQAEEALNNKIQKLHENFREYQLEHDKVLNDFNTIVEIEKLNEFGIMFGSVLDVRILNASDLRVQNMNHYNSMTYCLLSCASRKFQTKLSDQENPVWNESFTFPIYDGNEHLQILIKDNLQNNFDFIGELIFPISKFANQKKNDLILDILDKDGNIGTGKIHIVVQWIYSKSRYLRENLDFIEREISTLLQTQRDYEESLRTLYLPFQGLLLINRYETPSQQMIQKSTQLPLTETLKFHPTSLCYLLWTKKICSLTLLYLLLSIFICFNRSLFLDMVIYTIYIGFVYLKRMNQKALRVLIVSLIVSLLIDMSWMILFSEHYWSPTSTNLMTSVYERSVNRFVVVMSYILFIMKIGLILLYVNESLSVEMRVYSR